MCVSSVAISGGCFVFFCWLQELNRFLDTPINIVHTVLQLNEQALKFSPEKLISVTAYNGAVGSALPKEFPDFADTPGIFRHAAVRYPTLYRSPRLCGFSAIMIGSRTSGTVRRPSLLK
jgi:hypothetical protein